GIHQRRKTAGSGAHTGYVGRPRIAVPLSQSPNAYRLAIVAALAPLPGRRTRPAGSAAGIATARTLHPELTGNEPGDARRSAVSRNGEVDRDDRWLRGGAGCARRALLSGQRESETDQLSGRI